MECGENILTKIDINSIDKVTKIKLAWYLSKNGYIYSKEDNEQISLHSFLMNHSGHGLEKGVLSVDHINRNKYNVFPDGKLIYVKDNTYVDNNRIIWIRRFFLNSIFNNPFENYLF